MRESIESLSILGLGILTLFWIILKLVSSIMISGFINANIFHLNGMYWWFGSIIIFCIINKIIFYNNDITFYNNLVDNYTDKEDSEEELN